MEAKSENNVSLGTLTAQRDALLTKIREIEEVCEGIENENNAEKVQQLNLELAQLNAQKTDISAKLTALNTKISAINTQITQLSVAGTKRILEAIKNQRWYFFKNKPKVLMDKTTGLLWANLNYFPYSSNGNYYSPSSIEKVINNFDFETEGFRVPTPYELWDMIYDKTFPFQSGDYWRIRSLRYVAVNCGKITHKDLDTNGAITDIVTRKSIKKEKVRFNSADTAETLYNNLINAGYDISSIGKSEGGLLEHMNYAATYLLEDGVFRADISVFKNDRYSTTSSTTYKVPITDCNICICPCSSILVDGTDYKNSISPNNAVYTEEKRLQFTLDLFQQNGLLPIFDDDEITQIYKKIYFEKPELLKKLQEIQSQINSLQKVVLLSSEFDYTVMLVKYDIKAVNQSVIQYYHAVQKWTDELLEKLDNYEKAKEKVISDFNIIGIKLTKKYENSDRLTDEENTLLCNRQRYFASRFSLGMNSVKTKILAVKHQADDIEYRIDEIDNGNDAIRQLALLEKEERASFEFIAENTAKIVRNALKKIEFFEANHQYVVWAIDTWEKWTESYRIFKTNYLSDLQTSCEEDGIEQEVWQKWYNEWQALRFRIEEKLQPVIDRELHQRIVTVNEEKTSVSQKIISALENYRNQIDTFYRDDRKGIYQSCIFQSNGDIQDKLETESKLYHFTAKFQLTLQDIIFSCAKAEDRIFILNWANSLLDIQIDDILTLIADNDMQKISDTVLTEFSQLKQKNYEIYLADAKSYSKEQERREKQFNSLLFKMRKGLR